jgi:hypothetical protein
MDLSRLSMAHKIAIGGAIVLLIDSFLSWYKVSGFGISIGINAWDAGFLAWGGVLFGVAAGVVLALKATGKQDVKAAGKSAEQIALILGITSFVLIVLRLVTESSFMAFGLFIGIAAAAAVAYGAWMASKEAGVVAPTTAGTTPAPPTL